MPLVGMWGWMDPGDGCPMLVHPSNCWWAFVLVPGCSITNEALVSIVYRSLYVPTGLVHRRSWLLAFYVWIQNELKCDTNKNSAPRLPQLRFTCPIATYG